MNKASAQRYLEVHRTAPHEGGCNACSQPAVFTIHLGGNGGMEIRLCLRCRKQLVTKTKQVP